MKKTLAALVLLVAGSFAAAAVSLIIGVPTLRAKLRSDYFAIAILGFSAGAHLAIPELHLEMTVETMDGNRIDSVLVHKTEPIKPPQADAEEDD